MSPTGERRTGTPPPDDLRELHRRLAVVLADLAFPAQRWQLLASADLYGADTVTRSLLERAPDQRYQALPELVAVLGAVLRGRPAAPVPAATRSAPLAQTPTRTPVRPPARTPIRPPVPHTSRLPHVPRRTPRPAA